MVEYVGQLAGKYRLKRLLSRGSLADVYLGEQIEDLKREVVLKIFYQHGEVEDTEFFHTMGGVVSRLIHPRIVRVHEVGVFGERPFLVMDYVSGGSMRERHPVGDQLTLATILVYARAIAAALDYAHEHCSVHGDLKPENLLLDQAGELVVSDFCMRLALSTADQLNRHALRGTAAYIAPEQIRGRACAASDQYALALIVCEWLLGQQLFMGSVAEVYGQHLFITPSRLAGRVVDLSPLVEPVLLKALAKDPNQRFPSLALFVGALEQASQYEDVTRLYATSEREVCAPPVLDRHPMYASPPVRRRSTHLPVQLTSLVGRTEERRVACLSLLRPEVRLLTFTGPGGVGKTRLALAVAEDILDVFSDGVCFVPLAAVRDTAQVLSEIFRALELLEDKEADRLATLKHFLRDKHLLLVLDNLEQVLAVAPLLLDLLQVCPDLTMLATSRAVLHIPGEHTFLLLPLLVPDLARLSASASARELLLGYAAVELFEQRARSVHPDFCVTESNARVVAEICIQLDGLPLALELAAARIKLLSLKGLLIRLKKRLDLLSYPAYAVHQRHQTVRNTLRWSYELLDPAEQCLFERLAVFVDGGDLAGVEALYLHLTDNPAVVLDLLTSLLDKSLLYRVEAHADEKRWRMLEMVREFGLECAEQRGELERIRWAHANYYFSLLPDPEPVEMGVVQVRDLALLKQEYENLRTALYFLADHQETEKMAQLAMKVGSIWFLPGYRNEGQQDISWMLERSHESWTAVATCFKAMILYMAGRLAMYNLDALRARELLHESLQLCRELADPRYLGVVISCLGFVECNLGNYREADALYDEVLPLVQGSGDRHILSRLLLSYGCVHFSRGEFGRARALYGESLPVAREFNDTWLVASNLYYMGWAAYCEGLYKIALRAGEESVALFRQLDFPATSLEAVCILAYEMMACGELQQAQRLFEEARLLCHSVEDLTGVALALCGQGYLCLRSSNPTRARQSFEESLAIVQKIHTLSVLYRFIPASCLEGLAEIAAVQGQVAWTARLLGAAKSWRSNRPGYYRAGIEQPFYNRARDAARLELGEELFLRTFKEGGTLTPAQVLAARDSAALTDAMPVPGGGQEVTRGPGAGDRPADRVDADGTRIESLTRREKDVLRWLAQGLTNAEIAETLVISIVTVNSYLRSIYTKLGVSSRTQAMRRAIDQHILP